MTTAIALETSKGNLSLALPLGLVLLVIALGVNALVQGLRPTAASGEWYRETGSGMGATLNAGIGMGAYVMTDRATWISFDNKQDYTIAVEGDEETFNQYGVIPVNPEKCPSVNAAAAQTFADWLVSDEGQEIIAGYKIDGQQLFFPNAPAN